MDTIYKNKLDREVRVLFIKLNVILQNKSML